MDDDGASQRDPEVESTSKATCPWGQNMDDIEGNHHRIVPAVSTHQPEESDNQAMEMEDNEVPSTSTEDPPPRSRHLAMEEDPQFTQSNLVGISMLISVV